MNQCLANELHSYNTYAMRCKLIWKQVNHVCLHSMVKNLASVKRIDRKDVDDEKSNESLKCLHITVRKNMPVSFL